MMMKRACLILFLVPFSLFLAKAQQRAQYSQYMNNWLLLNPAVAGAADAPDLRAGYRLQWAGFKDAPRSFYLSAHLPTYALSDAPTQSRWLRRNFFHGIGAILSRDATGPTSRTGAYLAYAYHQKLTKSFRASLGAQFGLQQFSLDGGKLIYADQGSGSNLGFSKTFPDAAVGLWAYSKRFWAGASIQQIFRNQFSTYDFQQGIYMAHRHLFFSAGAQFPLGKSVNGEPYLYSIVPSVLVKSIAPTPPTVDVNLKLWYKKLLWGGVSYRTSDAVVVMAGLSYNGFDFGYSYDAVRIDISRYQRGSHELVIGFRPPPKKRISTPADFWR